MIILTTMALYPHQFHTGRSYLNFPERNHIWMKKIHLLFGASIIMTFFIMASGCRSVSPAPGVSFENDTLTRELADRMNGLYPDHFTAIHRCILEFGGKSVVLNGYALVRRSEKSFRLIGQSEMGVTLFDVVQSGEQTISIPRLTKKIRRTWIEKGAARDVSALYLRKPEGRTRLVKYHSGDVGIVSKQNDRLQETFIFDMNPVDKKKYRLKSYILSDGDTCVYRADFKNYGIFPKWSRNVPKTILVSDYRLNYKMTVNVLSIAEKTREQIPLK